MSAGGGTIAGVARSGGAALHAVSRDEGLLVSYVPSIINVVSDPPVWTYVPSMEGRRDPTAISPAGAVPDISTIRFGSRSMNLVTPFFRLGSITAVRRTPDRSAVVTSAALVSSEQTATTVW